MANHIIKQLRKQPTIIVVAEVLIVRQKLTYIFRMKNEFVDYGQDTDTIIKQFGRKRKKFFYTSKKGRKIELSKTFSSMLDKSIATEINIIKRKPSKSV